MILIQSLLLAAHLLVMNIASAGPLASVALQFTGGQKDAELRRLGQKIAACSLACLIFGALFGLTSGWIMWTTGEERFFQALGRFDSKIFFGLWELAFYVFCMGIYIAWWRIWPPKSVIPNVLLALVGVAAATNLLWHFPALMTAIAHIAATEPVGDDITPSAFRALIFDEQLMSRWLHVWMASFATVGLFVSWYAQRLQPALPADDSDETPPTPLSSANAWGGRVALLATLLQIPLGMWLLLSSPPAEQSRLMGGDLLATGMFLVSMTTALALMHFLAAIALGSGTSRNINLASLMLVLTITFMSGTLLLARGDAFQPQEAAPSAAEVSHQTRSFPHVR